MPRPQRTTAPDEGTTETAPVTQPTPEEGQSKMVTEGNPTPAAEVPSFDSIFTAETVEAPAPEPQPSKLSGKSLEDVARMYEELERKFGQQGAELGQLRQQLKPQQAEPEDPAENQKLLADFLANPKKFVQGLQQQFMGTLTGMMSQAEVLKVKQEHLTTLTDAKFHDWVRQNVPVPVIQALDSDPQALKFVLNSYKGSIPEREPAPKPTGIPAAPRAAARAGSKPVINREALQRLMMENPDEYEARMPEIEAAYRDGRVK